MQQSKKQFEQNKRVFSIHPGTYALSFVEPLWCTPNTAVHAQSPNALGAYTMFLCLRGKGRLEHNGKLYGIERGCVWFTEQNGSPMLWHEYDRQETQLLVLTFSINPVATTHTASSYDRALTDFCAGRTNVFGYDPSLCAYSDFFKNRIGSNRAFCLESTLAGFLLDCIFTLIEGSSLLSDKDRVLVYVTEHAREKVSVADLAKLLSVSERSLFYFFSENFQISPNEFINRIRMRSAAECLQKGISVKEVSEMYKFSESSSFCRMFKKYFGITPTEYQRLIESEMNAPDVYGGYIDTCPSTT